MEKQREKWPFTEEQVDTIIALIRAEFEREIGIIKTIDEVADRLSVTKRTLYEWDRKGILPRIKICGKIYYRKADISKAIVKGRLK